MAQWWELPSLGRSSLGHPPLGRTGLEGPAGASEAKQGQVAGSAGGCCPHWLSLDVNP